LIITRSLVLVFGALFILSWLALAQQPEVIKKTLTCGDAELTAETTCLNIPNMETQCTKQSIRLVNSKKGIAKQLPLDGKLVKEKSIKDGPVLDGFVAEWDCPKSKSGTPYVLLWYYCNWGRDCVGNYREWGKIFSVDGTYLAGFRKQGNKRFNKLYQQLEGVKLKSVIYREMKAGVSPRSLTAMPSSSPQFQLQSLEHVVNNRAD